MPVGWMAMVSPTATGRRFTPSVLRMATWGWDHRAFDGAYASAFLGKIKELLETRDWSAEL